MELIHIRSNQVRTSDPANGKEYRSREITFTFDEETADLLGDLLMHTAFKGNVEFNVSNAGELELTLETEGVEI